MLLSYQVVKVLNKKKIVLSLEKNFNAHRRVIENFLPFLVHVIGVFVFGALKIYNLRVIVIYV